MRKTLAGISDNCGDKDPPRKIIEKSHTMHTYVKGKINTQTTGLRIPKIQ